jgi:hypothetical protein
MISNSKIGDQAAREIEIREIRTDQEQRNNQELMGSIVPAALDHDQPTSSFFRPHLQFKSFLVRKGFIIDYFGLSANNSGLLNPVNMS